MNNNVCQVSGCRYNKYHTTSRHCCGTCKLNGHGQIECGNEKLIKELEKYEDDYMYYDYRCKINNCIDNHTHTTNGHTCLYCDKPLYDNHLKYCPNNTDTSEGNSICDNMNEFNSSLLEYVEDVKLNPNEYKTSSGGMGCTWLIRNNINTGKNEYLFMHSDNWGQYGEESSHLPRYKAFIYEYTLVD